MKLQQPTYQYLIRYKDLEGKSCEQSLYASNAMEARSLAMGSHSDLGHRPNLIRAILKANECSSSSFTPMAMINGIPVEIVIR